MWLALLVAASESPAQLDPDHTVEYAQYFDDGWRWFYIPTNNSNAVTASLVTQRGEQNNFPKMGFVLLSSQSSETVPSFSNPDNYDPDGYEHDFPIGPRLQYNRDTTFPSTDWRALTVGYDTSASASDPASTQVPLENVLIGIRCYETDWTAPLAGCRYSLTAQLLPFALQPGDRIVSPMGRIYRAENANGGTVASPATHIYRVEVGGYDLICLDRGHGGYGGDVGDEWARVNDDGSLSVDACFASGWADELRSLALDFLDATGLAMLETDGPYGGGVCSATNHSHHRGREDSVYMQTKTEPNPFLFF